jgi:hypothetical protein
VRACPLRNERGAHSLTWGEVVSHVVIEAFAIDEVEQRMVETVLDYDFTCSVIEDRIALLARYAGLPFPG